MRRALPPGIAMVLEDGDVESRSASHGGRSFPPRRHQDQHVTYSTMVLAHVYIMGELRVVRSIGIEGVMETAGRPSSGQPPQQGSAAVDRYCGIRAAMDRWLDAFHSQSERAHPWSV